MRLSLTVSSFIPLATLLAACTPLPTMDPIAVDLQAHLAELETEFDTHATGCAAATSVSAIATLDAAHRTSALALLGKLDELVGHMGHCTNEAKATPDVVALKDALAKLRSLAEGHSALVAGMPGLTEAQAEEARHHTDLTPHLTTCKTQSASMKTMAPKFMCAHSPAAGH